MPKKFSRLAGVLVAGWLMLLCVHSASGAANAVPRYSVEAWGVSEMELPQGSVITMLKTRDGYLWLGTLNGLVRFDGSRFTVFDESNTPGLNSSRIVHLFEDSQKN
ncbi:MAG: two-component regulator propeller domain-containing protein, partial [Verrucomicrobiota bacterium]